MVLCNNDNRSTVRKYVDSYFDTVAEKALSVEKSQDVIAEMDLENLMWAVDFASHPRFLLNQLYECELLDRLARLQSGKISFYKEMILREIFFTKLENRKTFHVRYNNEEYYTDRDYNLIPFSEAGGLTDINAMRLIEKIQSRVESQGSNSISIAYFGKLTEKQTLVRYFREKNVELCLHEYCFRAGSKYVYEDKSSQKVLHLIDLYDLKQFVQEYDIILLLDEASFYKQFGSKKKFREQRRTEFIMEYYEHGKASRDLIDKCGFYTKMYEEVLRYLADKKTEMSGAYEFDDLVLRSFKGIVDAVDAPCADIYCYISTGGRIANRNIEHLNICKDEFYQGKNLIVYKISKNSAYSNSQPQNKNREMMSFEVWKLVKSIDNNFYKKTGISEDIDFWKDWTVEINTSQVQVKDNEIFRVPYQIHSSHGNKEIAEIRKLVEAIFEMAFAEDDLSFSCVTIYLQTIISSILLCNAKNVDEILMAYMIKSGKKAKFVYTESQFDGEEHSDEITLSSYRERKTVFTIIEGLNSIFIRDMKYKDQIIRFDFKEKYAPELDEEIYNKYLMDIHRASESYGLTSMRTFLYT